MTYTGSTKSKKYHTLDCMWGKVIPDDYVVHFSDCREAEAAGFSHVLIVAKTLTISKV